MRGGIIAVFGRRNWMATKAIRRTAMSVSKAMMRALAH
jgi:hypothetical protein